MENKKAYEAPTVLTYAEEDLLELLGPAQTCTSGYTPT